MELGARVLTLIIIFGILAVLPGCVEKDKEAVEGKIVGEVFYVATNGNDNWSGKPAEPNGAKTDGPFATLERARDALRELKQKDGLKQPATVLVHGGEYALGKTFVLTTQDSGTKDCPVTFRSCPGETVFLAGGRSVGGWKKHKENVFVTSLADQGFEWFRFHQIFFKGKRQVLARHPDLDPAHPGTGGFLYVDAPSHLEKKAFYYDKGEIPFDVWGDASQAEVNIFPYNCWDHNIIPVKKVDPETRHVILKYPVAGQIHEANRYFVQNVLDALDAPGEWYVDYRTGQLYFYPPGGKVEDGDVIVPVLENIVEISGAAEAPVRHLRLHGFSFRYCEQDAVALEGAEHCAVTGNTVSNVGGIGVNAGYLRNAKKGIGNRWAKAGLTRKPIHSGDRSLLCSHACQECRIAGNDVHSIGGDGVVLVGTGNVADNNHIYRTGLFDRVCAGVTVYGDENVVSHNEIHDTPRDGIFINGAQNVAEYNSIRNTMLYTADNSAIALRQHNPARAVKDRGNVLRFNKIFDTIGYGSYPHCTHPPKGFGSPYCSWGIYLDGSICGVTVYGNVIVRSAANSVFIQFGGGNIAENNILVETIEEAIQYDCMMFFGWFMHSDKESRFPEPPNEIKHNIFYYAGKNKKLYVCGLWGHPEWNEKQAVFDSNLIWHNNLPIQIELDKKRTYDSLQAWQAAGHDRHSIVADPLFVNASKDDYRLRPDSPAYTIGFKDINSEIEKIGAYKSEERAMWPLTDLILQREEPVVFEYKKPPKPIVEGFELTPCGNPPGRAQSYTAGAATIMVTDEASSAGGQGLKFTDASGLKETYKPHLVYRLNYPSGKLHFSVDTLNTKDAPAEWYMEFRDWRDKLLIGPTFAGARDGRLTACGRFGGGGRELAVLPNGKWVTVAIEFETGEAAPKTYTLTLKTEGEKDRVFANLPFADSAFTQATWFGISSTSTERTVFYVDNLLLGPADSQAMKEAMTAPAIKGLPAKPPPMVEIKNSENIALHWKFDDANGDDLTDSSGNGLTGDLGGVARATGDFGRALYLDGSGAGIELEDNPLIRLGTSDFTIECWVCPTMLDIDSAHKRRRLLYKGLWPNTWWNVDILCDGKVRMEMTDAGKQTGTTDSDGSITPKEWTYLAIVVDRGKRVTKYYFNGKLDSAKALPPAFAGNLDIAGASLATGGWQPFIGLLDELKIYKRVLTDSEISQDFQNSREQYTSIEFRAQYE
ncbi:MAG: LamG-like jellyroll fold domain-containing protein [Planctomycetota bacterium]